MNLVKITARVLLAMVVLCGFLGAMELATSRMAHADTTPQYTVDPTTAAGGVYARYGPHTNDTQRTVGYGVYPNQVVTLLCGVTDGDPVGEYQNTVWHFVSDLSNPGEGNFWLSDYYVDTPNLTANQLAPNESTCANESSNPMATPTQQPTTSSSPQYTVDPTTAAGGVYARYGPHTNDTQSIGGYGVYPGETVELLCGVTDGDPVGIYQNTVWHYVSDLSNPGEGNFWLSDYYVDTPNLTANQLAPNESTCADESQNPMATPAQQTIPEGASVFFMPAPSFWQNIGFQPSWPSTTADLTVQYQDWATGNNCTYNDSFSNPYNGKWVSILGGWSLSRLGPVYYLANATPEQVSHVHYILLIDPGNASDFGTCDSSHILGPNKMSAASVLAMWLSQNQNNHLQIMAAERTASDAGTGLSQDYLSSIQSAGLMNQVTVCWNDALSHEDAFVDYAVNTATSYMNSDQSASCQQN